MRRYWFSGYCGTVFMLVSAGVIAGCFLLRPRSAAEPHPGMRLVAAAGKSFMQGANDTPLAGADEMPPMKSAFSYNFWMDTTLVTQKEYAAVTGYQPVADSSPFGRGDNYPQYNVTWYDAILYCNERSKKENLDTVYGYVGAPQMQAGSVVGLAGVIINYDVDGYRLPTEAEWEYAAREGTSTIPFPHLVDTAEALNYAWFSSNSGGATHPVAKLLPNLFGLYDMAGNLYQWTNDWKGFYCVSGITNSIGAPTPADANVKSIKGGSFEHPFLYLRPSRRESTYETVLSTAVEYIGFRCVRGVIAKPTQLITDTSSLVTNLSALAVSTVQPIFYTQQAKLVFVNVTNALRTLCVADFYQSNPYIYEFKDFTNVNAPAISPDGQFAAFCTRGVGSTGPATIYVRSLDSVTKSPLALPADSAYQPRWWVDPSSLDTFIIYTGSTVDNTASQWPLTGTSMQQMAGGRPVGAAQLLISNGSFHDGRSRNGHYLVTGYRSLLMRAVSGQSGGANRQLFTAPFNGKDSSGSTQVCNVSMSPDTADDGRCLFLDFGYGGLSSLTGNSYGIHQYMFVAGYSDTVGAWYRCPSAEASWDYTQWSNFQQFAVAGGCTPSGASHAIYVIDLQASLYYQLAVGTDLEQPALWINPQAIPNPTDLNLDSLGQYNTPALFWNQPEFMDRMQPFFRDCQTMQVAFVGSSHTAFEVNPQFFTGAPVYNMAIEEGDPPTEYQMINNYILPHCPSIKLIGMDIILGYMFWPKDSFYWYQGISTSEGYLYDQSHQFWPTPLPTSFVKLINAPASPAVSDLGDTLGNLTSVCAGWGGPNPYYNPDMVNYTLGSPTYQGALDSLKAIIRTLSARGIYLLCYVTPESPYYDSTISYGKQGPLRPIADTIIAELYALQDTFPFFHFYDANNFGMHDYVDSEARDESHLCEVGGRKFSHRLDSIVHSILGQ
jgi:uncharacterized protein (TIGR02171 family)